MRNGKPAVDENRKNELFSALGSSLSPLEYPYGNRTTKKINEWNWNFEGEQFSTTSKVYVKVPWINKLCQNKGEKGKSQKMRLFASCYSIFALITP